MNDVQVQGFSHQDASAILRKAEGTAKLVIGRPAQAAQLELPSVKKELRRMKTVQQEQLITLNKVLFQRHYDVIPTSQNRHVADI